MSKKHNKLKKKEAGGGGFRKMFGRNKNRQSKAPGNAGEALNGSQGGFQPGGATLGRRFSGFRKKSPVTSPVSVGSPGYAHAVATSEEDETTPVASPHQQYD
jgi:hypothetical protein